MQLYLTIAFICSIASIVVIAVKVIGAWITSHNLKSNKSDIIIKTNSGKTVRLKSKYKQTSPKELIESMTALFVD